MDLRLAKTYVGHVFSITDEQAENLVKKIVYIDAKSSRKLQDGHLDKKAKRWPKN